MRDDFENGSASGWSLDPSWQTERDDTNYVLSGKGHRWARAEEVSGTIKSFEAKVKLLQGAVHVNFRISDEGRYFVALSEGSVTLNKSILKVPRPDEGDPWDHLPLEQAAASLPLGNWHAVKVVGQGNRIQVYIDGSLRIDYKDDTPLLYGSVAFETLPDSHVHFDEVSVTAQVCAEISWQKAGELPGGGLVALQISPIHTNVLYAATNVNAMGIWKSTDSGATWQRVYTATHFTSLVLHPADPDMAYAVDLHGKIHKSDANGWRAVYELAEHGDQFSSLAMAPSNPLTLYAGTQRGNLYRTEDGGDSWALLRPPQAGETIASLAVDPSQPSVVYAATRSGVLKSVDGGSTWAQSFSTGELMALAIDPANPNVVYAGGAPGLFKSEDGGQSWHKVSQDAMDKGVHYVALAPSDTRMIYASTHDGIFKSHDGGKSWVPVNTGLRFLDIGPIAVDPSNPEIAYAGTGLWAWIPAHGHAQQDIYFGEGIYKTTDGGESWVKSDKGFYEDDVNSLAADPATPDILYAGTQCSRGVYRSLDGGQTWGLLPGGPREAQDLAHYTMMISPAPNGPLYLAGRFGFAKSYDQGLTWQNLFRRTHIHGIAFHPANPNTVYIGSVHDDDPTTIGAQGAHIYESWDGGVTWEEKDAGFPHQAQIGVHDLVMDPANPNVLYVATSSHEAPKTVGIFKTVDGGESWAAITKDLTSLNVLSLAIDCAETGVLYAGTGDGVFKTVDGGESWESTSLTRVAVHSVAVDPRNANIVYAGTSQGVFITKDGGRNWYSVSLGLPAGEVESVAISKERSFLYVAVRGAGVFRAEMPLSD